MRKLFYLIALILCACSPSVEASAEDPDDGYRFPMCDEFLPLKWLNPRLGQVTYTLYTKTSQRQVTRLVALGRYLHIDYDISEFLADPKQYQTLLEVINNGKTSMPVAADRQAIEMQWGEKTLSIEPDIQQVDETLGQHRKNVCVLFPDKSKAWLVEMRTAQATYNQAQIQQLMTALQDSRSYPSYIDFYQVYEAILNTALIDINGDGLDDFPLLGIYSYQGRYYRLVHGDDGPNGDNFTTLVFPPKLNTCPQVPFDDLYITTSGTHFFLNLECDLTQVTSPKQEARNLAPGEKSRHHR
jgi:hypothetical protein